MPDDQAREKSDLLLKLGAEVERVRPASIVDRNQFVNRARTRAHEHTADARKPGRGFFADQFETEANWRAHYEGTGPEIMRQTDGKLDAFVAGAGTGGTISGVARFLKPEVEGGVKIVLADPQGSGLLNKVKYGVMFDEKEREGTRRRHQVDTIVEGIGLNRLTMNFEAGRALIDDAVRVTDEQAIAMAQWLVEKDGIFAGSSSAVNCESDVSVKSKYCTYPCANATSRCGCYQSSATTGPGSSYRDPALRLGYQTSVEILGKSRHCRKQDRHGSGPSFERTPALTNGLSGTGKASYKVIV